MRDDPTPPLGDALRYAAGDLPADDAAAFEARLAADPAAQDALAEAVRLSARAVGHDEPTADPLTRSAVRDRLRPAATTIGRAVRQALRRRPYRGHPAGWLLAGAAAVVVGGWAVAPAPSPPDSLPEQLAGPPPRPTGDPMPTAPATTLLPPDPMRPAVPAVSG